MSYRALKRLIGESGLERKCRVLLGAGNAAGGYVVTERMLEMFKPSTQK